MFAVCGAQYGAPKNLSAIRPASLKPLSRAPWTVAGQFLIVCSPAKNRRDGAPGGWEMGDDSRSQSLPLEKKKNKKSH